MASYKSSATWVPIERRSLANRHHVGRGFGRGRGHRTHRNTSSLIGWRGAFTVFAGVIMLAVVFILLAAPRKDTIGASAPLKTQFAQMIAIIRRPLFWRVAPLLGFTSGVQIGIQTLWAGPWLRDVMGYSREEVAHHLLFMALAFMVGILAVGVSPTAWPNVVLVPCRCCWVFNLIYFAAQC
jgi:predicted MFS family arabinose efflux permease